MSTFEICPVGIVGDRQSSERGAGVERRHVSPTGSSVSMPGQSRAQMPRSLLLEATRVAGAFQRSALGHLDHHEWADRVETDGQRLINVLVKMGFKPARRDTIK